MLAESEAGDPAEAIVRFASQRGARLVVIGKDGDDWLSDTLFGETALELLQTTDVPVMIVRRGQAQPARRVLVAVDFGVLAPGGQARLRTVSRGRDHTLERLLGEA